MRNEAVWEDGQPITAEDFLFTIKAAMNPHSLANAWRGFMMAIDSVLIYDDSPKHFKVFIGKPHMLAEEISSNFNVYPKHIYDPNGHLDAFTLDDLRQDSVGGKAVAFAKDFVTAKYSRETIIGSGPYKFSNWVSNQSLVLKKKKDWWGEKYSGTSKLMMSGPDQLIYFIVPDETTALTMLKDGQLDVVSGLSPTAFNQIKENSKSQDLSFATPAIMQYYYLGLNNKGDILKNKKIRLALAHILDTENLSEVLMANLAKPVVGPIHPSKPHYNKNLSPIKYDLNKASQLLSEEGWSDTDDNGVLDKNIDGQKVDLELEVLVTQKELGRNLARILKDNASKVGVEIKISSLEWGRILKKLQARDFDIVAMATRQSPGLDDLYQSWHTESAKPGGRNIVGFGNELSDSLIMRIRAEEDPAERTKLYHRIQEIIQDEQPMVFLFAPSETIVYNNKIDLVISSRRPGYFENTAQLKK